MRLFSTAILWDFLIFIIGSFGFMIAERVQDAISKCSKKLFAVVFITVVYVILNYIKSKVL